MYFNAPLNSVSFGQVSFNILQELQKRQKGIELFPIGNVDLSSFNVSQELNSYLNESAATARDNFKAKNAGLKVWHISGLMESVSRFRCALTFHETDRLTPTEINILDSMDVVFVTSNYTKAVFEAANVKCRVVYMPLGLDKTHIKKLNRPTNENEVVFGIFGKMEKRKSTLRVIKAWAEKYGNNKKYKLHAAITNPFLSVDVQRQMIASTLGKNYWNINFLPFVSKNDQYNEILNSVDVDLTGMSLCEGFNLPAFQCLCLGKQGVFLNAHVHRDYVREGGAVLVEPTGEIDVEDGLFFKKGEKFNQGRWVSFKDEDLIVAMEEAESKAKQTNTLGEGLQEQFTYQKTVDILLENLGEAV